MTENSIYLTAAATQKKRINMASLQGEVDE
jgi:hypothetical protein